MVRVGEENPDRAVSGGRKVYVLLPRVKHKSPPWSCATWSATRNIPPQSTLVRRLPQSTVAALSPEHLHSISPLNLPDGREVLVCHEGGREW